MRAKTIFYDGECDMCSTIMNKVENSSASATFCKVDLTTDKLPKGLTRKKLAQEIHVVEDNGVIHKKFNAILSILEEYPKLKVLVTLGRLPLINSVGNMLYTLISKNRHFIWGQLSRIFWLKVTLCLGFIAALVLSPKLWLTNRLFPHVPVVDWLPTIPTSFDGIIFITLLVALTSIIFLPKPQKLITFFVGIMIALCLLDQLRWQSFIYQYLFMFVSLCFFSWSAKDTKKASLILNTCRLIIICIYFWAGLQKVNLTFMLGVFPWFISPLTQYLPESLKDLISISSLFVPFCEAVIGLLLLSTRFRTIGVLFALGLHISILLALGPLGHNWAPVVWPWNIAMMCFVVILFWKTEDVKATDILWIKQFFYHKIILILFAFLPLLSFFNYWDSYLSFTMYSGNTNDATLYIPHSLKETLPKPMQIHVKTTQEKKETLDLFMWGYTELGVIPYPEKRIYVHIAQNICDRAKNKETISLLIHGKPTWFNRDEPKTYTCAELVGER